MHVVNVPLLNVVVRNIHRTACTLGGIQLATGNWRHTDWRREQTVPMVEWHCYAHVL